MDATPQTGDDRAVTWIPLPPLSLAHGRLRLSEGYHACPETGDVRNARGLILTPRRAGGRGSLAVHVWGQSVTAHARRKSSTTAARLVALALLAGGLVEAPNAQTHLTRASLLDLRERPRWSNLAWQGRRGVPRLPLVLTRTGLALLGEQEPR